MVLNNYAIKNSPLVTFLNNVHPLSKGAVNYIQKHEETLNLKKGSYLLKAGDIPDKLYLITKGVLRGFMIDDDKEITTWINEENEIVGSIRSLGLPELVSEENIEVVESAQVIGLSYRCVEYLYEYHPEMNVVARIILEQCYRDAEERAFLCRIPSAEKKYQRFLKTKPGLFNRISLKCIASYLSITQETLSRIRGREARKGTIIKK